MIEVDFTSSAPDALTKIIADCRAACAAPVQIDEFFARPNC
ncbi:hypothetical protein QP166_03485 [Sphingomonas sp. LR60]